jgi:hypothetical protein
VVEYSLCDLANLSGMAVEYGGLCFAFHGVLPIAGTLNL